MGLGSGPGVSPVLVLIPYFLIPYAVCLILYSLFLIPYSLFFIPHSLFLIHFLIPPHFHLTITWGGGTSSSFQPSQSKFLLSLF